MAVGCSFRRRANNTPWLAPETINRHRCGHAATLLVKVHRALRYVRAVRLNCFAPRSRRSGRIGPDRGRYSPPNSAHSLPNRRFDSGSVGRCGVLRRGLDGPPPESGVCQLACRRRRASYDGKVCPRMRATAEAALVRGPNPFTVVRPSLVTRSDRGEMTIVADGNCRPRTASRSLSYHRAPFRGDVSSGPVAPSCLNSCVFLF